MTKSQFDPKSPGFDADAFGRQLANQLADAPLTLRQQERLKAARNKALQAHARVQVPVGVLAGVGDWLHRHHIERARALRVSVLSLLLVAAAGIWWQNQSSPATTDEEVDAMLLSDDLPPDAYLTDQVDHLTQGS